MGGCVSLSCFLFLVASLERMDFMGNTTSHNGTPNLKQNETEQKKWMRKKFAMWHAFWHSTLLNLTPTSSPRNFLIQPKTLLLRSLSRRPDHYFVLLFYDFECKCVWVSIVYLSFYASFFSFLFSQQSASNFHEWMCEKKVWHGNSGWSNFLWLNFDSKIVSHAYIYTFFFTSSLFTWMGGVCMGKRNSTCKLYYVQKWHSLHFFRSFYLNRLTMWVHFDSEMCMRI